MFIKPRAINAQPNHQLMDCDIPFFFSPFIFHSFNANVFYVTWSGVRNRLEVQFTNFPGPNAQPIHPSSAGNTLSLLCFAFMFEWKIIKKTSSRFNYVIIFIVCTSNYVTPIGWSINGKEFRRSSRHDRSLIIVYFFNLTRSWAKPISRNLQFTTITNWNDQQSNISNRPFMRIIIIRWTQRLASLMNPVETIEHLDKNRNDSMACAIKSLCNNRFYTTLCFAGTAKFQMMTV